MLEGSGSISLTNDPDAIWEAQKHMDPTDTDPEDPYVFGPPGSFYHQLKIVRKT
jgi:hypothetical protein